MTSPGFKLTFRPLTLENWKDFESLFGKRGACGGCWCMYTRLPRKDFEKQKGAGNKRAMKRIVTRGECPGILAYAKGGPVGWCSIGPRSAFSRLERSRVMKPVDDQPVWSVVCFFIARSHRRRGMTSQLLRAAVEHARRNGARIVEGYPVAPRAIEGVIPDVFAWTGLASAFLKAGFTEVARRTATRPVMRYVIRRR